MLCPIPAACEEHKLRTTSSVHYHNEHMWFDECIFWLKGIFLNVKCSVDFALINIYYEISSLLQSSKIFAFFCYLAYSQKSMIASFHLKIYFVMMSLQYIDCNEGRHEIKKLELKRQTKI